MRVLAIETTSLRGTVALVEGSCVDDAKVCGYARHDEPNRHAERTLGLVDAALASAGWSKKDIERVAVGVGPGAFTGIRVGLSIAQGLMLGLGVSGVGVGSLRAIAAGASRDEERLRVVLRDARREEFFLAAYDQSGAEIVAPHAIPQEGAAALVRERFSDVDFVVLGTAVDGLPCDLGDESTDPDARAVGRLALEIDPNDGSLSPDYVRGPNVVKPKLPPSPLLKPRIE